MALRGNVDIQGATDEERRDIAKEVNYGILFQMTASGLARKLGTDATTPQRYIDTFWERYSVAKNWLEARVGRLKKKPLVNPYIQSYLERRRRFVEPITARDIRKAKATILQQTEVETLRLALIGLVGSLRRRKMKSRVVMIVHDAIWLEAPIEEAEEAKALLEQSMTGAVEYPFVRLEVDFQESDVRPRVAT